MESLANRCPDITHAFVGLQINVDIKPVERVYITNKST